MCSFWPITASPTRVFIAVGLPMSKTWQNLSLDPQLDNRAQLVLVRTSIWAVQCITTQCTVLHQVMYGAPLHVALESVVSPPPTYTMYIMSHVTQQSSWGLLWCRGCMEGAPTPAMDPLAFQNPHSPCAFGL